MQQIISFIIKNSFRLLFLLLFVISISLTVQSHSYHRSKVISSANFLTGGVYTQINNVDEYFGLKQQNEELAKENARLKSILFNQKDTVVPKNLKILKGVDKSEIIVSKVIHNSYSVLENYITLNSGSNDGVKTDMGVINSAGIIGIVDKASPKYSTVVSILNVQSRLNAKLKKSNHFGSLIWNGKSTGFAQLIDVPRLASVRKGDTIVTGGQSVIFPENIGIGTVDKIEIDDQTHYYTINVKLFNDMTNLGYVYIIKTKDREEVMKLQSETVKNE